MQVVKPTINEKTETLIPLYRFGQIASYSIVDKSDEAIFRNGRWLLSYHGYATGSIKIDGISFRGFMHRIILLGTRKSSRVVDHINGNRIDNRKSNLRLVTIQENNKNLHAHKKANNVYFDNSRKKWRTKIERNGNVYYLPDCETREEALRAALQFKQQKEKENVEKIIPYNKMYERMLLLSGDIRKYRNKWNLRYVILGKRYHIGSFTTENEAIDALDKLRNNLLDARETVAKLAIENTLYQIKIKTSRKRLISNTRGNILFRRNKWSARININKKCIHLGYFVSKEEAQNAIDKYASTCWS